MYAALGFVIGALCAYFFFPQTIHTRGFPIREKGFAFISPILGFEVATESKDFEEFQFLEEKLEDAVKIIKKQKDGQNISVYFRALNSGRWVGVNENEEYDGASLLKVATVIAYYKAAEANPSLLEKEYVWNDESGKSMDAQNIQPSLKLRPGLSYTADELVDRALQYSDNDAVNLLASTLTSSNILEVATDLNIPIKDNKIKLISPKNYSFLFRVLYNSTYLSRDISEKILKKLSQSAFTEGLSRGIPSTLTIAHKFGERTFISPTDLRTVIESEFHDCGIIYYPNHPYFLCVMTKGDNHSSQIKTITSLSKIVYEAMDSYWSSGKK